MTRYRVAAVVTALLGVAAWGTGRKEWAPYLLLALGVLIGFGVALPRMSFFGLFICQGTETHRRVALTFDDGPDARSTPALLDLLEQQTVQAAFFCIGRKVAAQPELTARIAREGHLLANHTYSHSMATNVFPIGQLRREMARTQTAIKTAANITPTFFRPPMGLSNPMVFRAARQTGLRVLGWSARGLDTVRTDSNNIVAQIEKGLRPGAIILLHDGNVPADRLVRTVSLLLQRLRELKYEVVRLDQML